MTMAMHLLLCGAVTTDISRMELQRSLPRRLGYAGWHGQHIIQISGNTPVGLARGRGRSFPSSLSGQVSYYSLRFFFFFYLVRLYLGASVFSSGLVWSIGFSGVFLCGDGPGMKCIR